MYSDYIYHVYVSKYEGGMITDYGFVKNINGIGDFFLSAYIDFVKNYDIGYKIMNDVEKDEYIDELNKMKLDVSFSDLTADNYEEKILLSDKFNGFEYIIVKWKYSPIQKKYDEFITHNHINNLTDEIKLNNNYSQIIVNSLLIKKENYPFGESINIYTPETHFRIYQKKYLNIRGYKYSVINSNGFVLEEFDPSSSSHVEIIPRLKWFLSSEFVNKILDVEYVENKINVGDDFVLDSSNMAIDSDFENLVLELIHVVKFIY